MTERDRIEFAGDRVGVGPATGPVVWFELGRVRACLLWSIDDAIEHAPGGHAYLIDGSDVRAPLELVRFAHGEVEPEALKSLHERVAARLGPDPERRRWVTWRPPDSRMSLTMDAGVVEAALAGRALVHRSRPNLAELGGWPELPEDFVRDPVGAWVHRELGALDWPTAWRAGALRPRFVGARAGDCAVMTGCRHGSRFAEIGQDRTAVVFVSTDAGASFTELPWRLGLAQQLGPGGQSCWPPEQIDRVRVTPTIDGVVVEIDWDDPWIDWEPGTEWTARWSPGTGVWTMFERR